MIAYGGGASPLLKQIQTAKSLVKCRSYAAFKRGVGDDGRVFLVVSSPLKKEKTDPPPGKVTIDVSDALSKFKAEDPLFEVTHFDAPVECKVNLLQQTSMMNHFRLTHNPETEIEIVFGDVQIVISDPPVKITGSDDI